MAKSKTKQKEKTTVSEVLDVDYDKRLLSEAIDISSRDKIKKSQLTPSEKSTLNRIEEELYKACVAEGMPESKMLKILNVDPYALRLIEKRLLANSGQKFLTKTTAHRYYEYMLRQEQCIKDLEYFIKILQQEIDVWDKEYKQCVKSNSFDQIKRLPKPSIQSVIMAVKAKSEIHDKVLKTGQEMGIIEKRAKEIRVSGNINLAALPTDKLKDMLSKKLKEFDMLVENGKIPNTYKKMLERSNITVDDDDDE